MAYGGFRQIFGPWFRAKQGQVIGIENLPDKPPFIVALNHEGFLDPLIFLPVLYDKYKRQTFFLTSHNMWKLWGEYLAKHWLGMIPLHDEDRNKVGAAVDEAIKYLKNGEIFGIFPEGSRNPDKENLMKGKTGTVRIAIGSKMQVIPIGLINNTGFRIGAAFKSLFKKDMKIDINIGEPIDFSEYYGRELTKELLEEATRKLMTHIGELCNKKYNF
ncbi:MAG: lysophospholipid acyltransferase family protein [bacterium]|nr:lysophospholipid acyltransferase family protein [bacterium]